MKQIRTLCCLALIFATSLVLAQANNQNNWTVNIQDGTVEAFTLGGNETSLGLFCAKNECFFYIHQPIPCQQGAQIPALLSSTAVATAVNLRCTRINNNLFAILEPFPSLLKATQESRAISFALPLSNGGFGILEFGLIGAKEAIALALLRAAQLDQSQNNKNALPKTPGITPLNQIEL